jgi:hypothetical protein
MEPVVTSVAMRDPLMQLYRIDDQIEYEIERAGRSKEWLQ